MSQRTSVAAIGAVFLAAGVALMPARQALAVDHKFISATECQPFLPTTYETALFKDNAIHNPTAVNQRVICPVNKDTFADWDEDDGAHIAAYIKAGAKPGKVACTLFGGGASFLHSNQVAYTGTSDALAAGASGFLTIPQIADPAEPGDGLTMEGWNVLCTLNPGMSLGGLLFNQPQVVDGND